SQDGAVRAAFASIRRTADRHRPEGVPGPYALLDGRGSGAEAPLFPVLLPRSSRACKPKRAHTGTEPRLVPRTRMCEFVSMAAALSRAVSDADGGVEGAAEGHLSN